MSDRVLSVARTAEEAVHELPMPIIAYFLIVFALFLVALAVTWSFRNTAYKLQSPHHDQHPQHQHEAIEPDGPHR